MIVNSDSKASTLSAASGHREHNIDQMVDRALPTLVIPNPRRPGGYQIVASAVTGNGADEQYATPFMRDSAMFMLGLIDAVEAGQKDKEIHLTRAMTALKEIEDYQAPADDPKVGVKKGQMPHELRFPFLDADHKDPNPIYQRFVDAKWKEFETNQDGKKEKFIASYDTSEGTHLYVLTVMRLEQLYPGFAAQDGRPERLKSACDYILKNSEEHKGLAGFVNNLPWDYLAEQKEAYYGLKERNNPDLPNTKREFHGAAFQEIRDQGDQCFPDGLKPLPGYAISGLQTTAIKYTAELMAADYYQASGNAAYAKALREDAQRTKQNFNDEKVGFLRKDNQGNPYFVEARGIHPKSGLNEQLPYKTASPIYALAYPYIPRDKDGKPARGSDGKVIRESVIDAQYIPDVVKLISQELYQPGFGVSTYSKNENIPSPIGVRPTGYWISNGNTCWGVEQFIAAKGLLNFGYRKEAFEIAGNANKLMQEFGSLCENWVKTPDGKVKKWTHPFFKGREAQGAGHTMAFVTGLAAGFWAQFGKQEPLTAPTPPVRSTVIRAQTLEHS